MASPVRTPAQRKQRGFTLVEMMLALAILVFGVTALAGAMLSGVSTRRGSEMRLRATNLIDKAVYDVQQDVFARADLSEPLQGYKVQDPPGFPGMKYSVAFDTDPKRPSIVLVRIKISWLEQGESMAEEFRRIMVRRSPFSRRVAARNK